MPPSQVGELGHGMGSLYWGTLVPRREVQSHQLLGTSSRHSSGENLYERSDRQTSSPVRGQLDSSGTHKQLGVTVSPQVTNVAQELWMWCLERNILLTAQRLPGKENVIADAGSRVMKDHTNWKLNPSVFQ